MLISYDEALEMMNKNTYDCILSISLCVGEKELDTKSIVLNFADCVPKYSDINNYSDFLLDEISRYLESFGYTDLKISLQLKAGKNHDRLQVQTTITKKQLIETKEILGIYVVPTAIQNCFVKMLHLLVD